LILRIARQFGFVLLAWALFGSPREGMAHDPASPTVASKAERRQVHAVVNDFSLTDQAGRPFRFKSLRGKVVLLTFLYTTCSDVCPLLTANMRALQQNLTARERQDVYFLSVTTDPEVDTPSVLKSYADRYKVDFSVWSFLTGDQRSLEPVWKMFGVKVERVARGLINHTTLTAVIDKKGIMRLAYSNAAPNPETVLADMRSLLSQP
jgi:protein SCO1/2